jgi:DNA-directed RNA polymerase specialized sigma24 family protein
MRDTLTKYEILVKALLEFNEELLERKFSGRWNLVDELVDLDHAISQATLTDKQRESVRLVYGENMGQGEAALALATSQPNISLHLTAAIRKIAKVYENWEAIDND